MTLNADQTHTTVLFLEVLNFQKVKSGGRYIDATVGSGGHSAEICKIGGEVLGLDQDPLSLDFARKYLENACPGIFPILVNSNFSKIQAVAESHGFSSVDGILMDLGFASFQMDEPTRGLSFSNDGPLDMRLDPNLGVTAADLVNSLPEKELEHLFREFGDEPKAHVLARKIVEGRKLKPFTSTRDLASLVEQTNLTKWSNDGTKSRHIGSQIRYKTHLHPATRIFMALRIAVNSELENLKIALPQAFELLKPGGRLLIISFHSGEDRIVKNAFRDWEREKKGKILTKKPVVPTEAEIYENPRARSAKLRVLEKMTNK